MWVGRELPPHPSSHFREMKTPGVILMERTISIQSSDKGSKITGFVTNPRNRVGGVMSQGKGTPLSQVTRQHEVESRVAVPITLLIRWLGQAQP